LAFLGSQEWLDRCAPAIDVHGLHMRCFPSGASSAAERVLGALKAFRPHATVLFDPQALAVPVDLELPGVTLGVLVRSPPEQTHALVLGRLDRLASFDRSLTGTRAGGRVVWRAIPPPVSDSLFQSVRAPHEAPRAMTIGTWSEHREAMLMPAKHHHDLLQLIHGVSGPPLVELLGEYDVGVYVAPEPGGGFGYEAGVHLAAGQLLLADAGKPAYGLERNIDYLHVGSADELVWVLGRLGRFPEMYQRLRVRGRLKAEQFRASRIFTRLVHDLLLDVAAFGADHT
jgi:hypothetical protein